MLEDTTRPSGANDTGLPDPVVVGAEPIAIEVYGPEEGKKETNIRRIYHAIAKKELPTFKLGGRVHARRSTIRKWIEKQEAGS